MSPDTAGHGNARTGVRTARRALMALAGVGVLAAIPFTVDAAVTATVAVQQGDRVVVTTKTPPVVRRALNSGGPVVVAFLLPGMTEDEIVQKRLNSLQKEGKFKDAKFVVFRITNGTRLGDLPTMFDVKYTPAVAVIQGDDRLSNVWRGLVDEDIIAQSLIDARAAVPHAIRVTPRKGGVSGNAAGIALARRVNARYVKVPGLAVQFTGTVPGVGQASGSGNIRLVAGRQRAFGATVTASGKNASLFMNRTGLYAKGAAAKCWTRNGSAKAVRSLGDPAIPLRGMWFGKPVKSADGKTLTLTGRDLLGQYGGGSIVFTIDATTFDLVSAAQGNAKQTYKALTAAPSLTKPDALC